jgi:acetyltransferase-like isoleucine patch superfamily enzyme
MTKVSIHKSSFVASQSIGAATNIWAFVNILSGAIIGENCNICDHCFIENEVVLGNNVTVKCGVYLWDGITAENDVFIGPNAVFTNDNRPRSKHYKEPIKTLLKQGASIGANSTILAGITIGKFAMTGIGSVVTTNVPDYALVYGNPAKIMGWVDEEGNKLVQGENKNWISKTGKIFKETLEGLSPIT